MHRGENISDSIPIDLFEEIFSRLPAKSFARFRCVSKLWTSMLHRPYITELFLTRFSARPRILFAVVQNSEYSFFSLPQSPNPYEKLSPLLLTADFHMKFSKSISEYKCSFASGLIYFRNMCIPKEDKDPKSVICNPITGHYVILPELRKVNMESYSYLVFDPIENKFKVLFMNTSSYIAYNDAYHYILTLGIGKMSWRKIQCPFTHKVYDERICINGFLYYKAVQFEGNLPYGIVCFDVRSEKFKFIDAESVNDSLTKLINYKGKLCGIRLRCYANHGRRRPAYTIELHMWVLDGMLQNSNGRNMSSTLIAIMKSNISWMLLG